MEDADGSGLASRARLVHRLAEDLGFALVGVAPAQASKHAEAVRRWIAAGRHGEMRYLARNLDVRLDPKRLVDRAESIICLADFHVDEAPASRRSAASSSDAPAAGRIARYAWGRDYHLTIKKRLHRLADALSSRYPDHDFRSMVDTAPALEREHASRAGLGWTGKHTLLIHPQYGSWMLLGLIVTTLRIQTSAEAGYPDPTVPGADHCGGCTRCIDACPTDCITPYSIDATRCISYLTIEHRTAIDPVLHEAMGDWIAGCDVCQEVCPFNNRVGAPPSSRVLADYGPRPPAPEIRLLEVLGWTAEDRREAFTGSALKRIKLDMLKRNALIAAGNALTHCDDSVLLARIEAIAASDREPQMVRATARQVLGRVSGEDE